METSSLKVISDDENTGDEIAATGDDELLIWMIKAGGGRGKLRCS